MHLLAAIVCGLLGFVAAVPIAQLLVRRTPMHMSLKVRFHCGTCGSPVQGVAKVPVLAILAGVNKCETCRVGLWSTVPWMELLNACAWAALGARFGWAWALPAYLVVAMAFLIIVVVDLRHFIIPNRVVYPALFGAGTIFGIAAILEDRPEAMLSALIGMIGAWLFFAVVWLISPRGLGFGDVRLAALVGLVTGWMGIGNVTIALFTGTLAGAIVGIGFILLKFLTRRDPIPYGPFLVFGAAVSIFFGEPIADWWLGS